MGFRDALRTDKFLITMDTIPPKGTDISGVLKRMSSLKGRVDGVNVVDMPSAVMRMSPLPLSYLINKKGFEPILQITCRDRNQLSLQAEFLSASVLGIHNFLLLTGDNIELSDDPNAKPVFELDSVKLLRAARGLEQDHHLTTGTLSCSPDFCLGAALDPGADPLEAEIEKMEKKISAGAEFFQTQPVYDVNKFTDFMKKFADLKTPILAGILLLKSAKMARYISENVPGINVPDDIINEMSKTKDPIGKSVEIAVRTIKSLIGVSKGVHIMTIEWEDKVPLILDALE